MAPKPSHKRFFFCENLKARRGNVESQRNIEKVITRPLAHQSEINVPTLLKPILKYLVYAVRLLYSLGIAI